jgi:ribosomal protein S18 acetylase RimI-like enzyme
MKFGDIMRDDIIRGVELKDLKSLDELFFEELRYHKGLLPEKFKIPKTLVNETWLDSILTNEREFLAVYESKGNLVGVILYKIKTESPDIILKERECGYIEELTVTEDYRGMGVGRKLLDFAINHLKEHGISEVELNIWEKNEMGMGFYEKYGFRTVQRRMKLDID